MGGDGRLSPEEVVKYAQAMQAHGVASLELPGLSMVLSAVALHYVAEPVLQSTQAVAVETEDERMVRLQREHTEREELVFHSSE